MRIFHQRTATAVQKIGIEAETHAALYQPRPAFPLPGEALHTPQSGAGTQPPRLRRWSPAAGPASF
jgi:hypothetical protein